MRTHFEQPGSLPRLGPIGRVVRALLGSAVLYFTFGQVLTGWQGWLRAQKGWELPGGWWWLLVILAAVWLSRMVDLLFTVTWGWRTLAVWAGVAAGLAALDRARYGSLWAAPLGGFLLLTVVAVLTVGGVSFLLQAVAATPG